MAASVYERARARMDNGWSRVRNFLGSNENVAHGPKVKVHRRTAKEFVGIRTPEGRAIVGTRRSRVHVLDDKGALLIRSRISQLHREIGYAELSANVVGMLLRGNTIEQVLNLDPAIVSAKIVLDSERNPGPHSPMTLGRGRSPYSFDGSQRG